MSYPSGSKWNRVAKCPASAALPQVEDDGSEASQRGTSAHAFAHDLGAGILRDRALEHVPAEHREYCEVIDAAAVEAFCLPRATAHLELALAYDVAARTSRLIGHNVSRNYGELGPNEIPLSLDVVHFDGRRVTIWDYKTRSGHDSTTPPASENWQLRVGAAACMAYWRDAETCAVGLVHITDEGRVYSDPPAVYERWQVEDFAAELEGLARKVDNAREDHAAGKTLSVTEGKHCQWCPAKLACPAKTGLIRQLVAAGDEVDQLLQIGARRSSEEPDVMRRTLDALTPENAARGYEMLKRIGFVYNKLKQAYAIWARENPIELADGTVYTEHESVQEELEGAPVYSIIAEEFGHDIAGVAVEMSTSKAAVKRAIKAAKDAGKLAGPMAEAERRIHAKAVAAGAVNKKTVKKLEERQVRQLKAG